VTLSANPVNGGTVSGAGNYAQGAPVTVTASANANYSFVNWTEGTNVVSTNSSYSFNISSNRSLTANFSPLTAVFPVNGTASVYAFTSGPKLIFKNLSGDDIYSVSVFNNLGQLVAKAKVNKTNPSITVKANGIVSVMITGRKSSSHFQVLVAD
jgi:hypothetical protein